MTDYSWQKLRPLVWATEEQRADTPDWYVYREDNQLWYAKGRTSALHSGPFRKRAQAQAYAETASSSLAKRHKAIAAAA